MRSIGYRPREHSMNFFIFHIDAFHSLAFELAVNPDPDAVSALDSYHDLDLKSGLAPAIDSTQDPLLQVPDPDIQLGESPVLLKLIAAEAGIMVVGYKNHWDVLETPTGQSVKRAESVEDNIMGGGGGGGGARRGTLVNALRIGDERDTQLVLCYNHTCHFERLTGRGLESDGEYDFHWTTVPSAVVCAFPYIMAFAEDLLEIRLVANGSLVHAACIPGLKLLCGRRTNTNGQDIFYVACAPEYMPLGREVDMGLAGLALHDGALGKHAPAYSLDEDDHCDRGDPNQSQRLAGVTPASSGDTNSASSRSSSISSEQGEHSTAAATRAACVATYLTSGSSSVRQRLAELRLDSKSRGGGGDSTPNDESL
ncbi:hypothetical protein EVAR_103256_1 [Eumeta japonica]|uniref:CNH domain-containing protein n=1 Tax=Eumeta variegata TaxID=151549 RepID=A0A4C1Y8I3_EUMVA|nr:hypothetical protein EVAR_103256_1 [Eumeta japonica]